MAAWIWILIPLAAIIGGMILEYQKNKMKLMNRTEHHEEQVEDLRKLVHSLKSRIENLEAIAAGAPEDFKTGAGTGMQEIEIDELDHADKNQQDVSDLAKKTEE